MCAARDKDCMILAAMIMMAAYLNAERGPLYSRKHFEFCS